LSFVGRIQMRRQFAAFFFSSLVFFLRNVESVMADADAVESVFVLDNAEAVALGIDSKTCEVCQEKFTTNDAKRRHVWEKHGGGMEPAVCKHGCGFAGVKKAVSDHQRVCSANSHECDLCHVKLKNRKSFLDHKKSNAHMKAEREDAKKRRIAPVNAIASLSHQLARVVLPMQSSFAGVPMPTPASFQSGGGRLQVFDNSLGGSSSSLQQQQQQVPHPHEYEEFGGGFGDGGFEPDDVDVGFFRGGDGDGDGDGAGVGDGDPGGGGAGGAGPAAGRAGGDDDDDAELGGRAKRNRDKEFIRGRVEPLLQPPPFPGSDGGPGRGLGLASYASTPLGSIFEVPPAGGRGRKGRERRGGLLEVIASPTFQKQFWESHGTNKASGNHARNYVRALDGIKASAAYVRAITAGVGAENVETLDVDADMDQFRSFNDNLIAVRILGALVRASRAALLPPSVFFRLDQQSRLARRSTAAEAQHVQVKRTHRAQHGGGNVELVSVLRAARAAHRQPGDRNARTHVRRPEVVLRRAEVRRCVVAPPDHAISHCRQALAPRSSR
jgi:hypothetical protein